MRRVIVGVTLVCACTVLAAAFVARAVAGGSGSASANAHAAGASAPEAKPGIGRLAGLGWLVGTWERRSRGRRVHETWSWAGEHALLGAAFVTQDGGEPQQTEWILLTEMAGDVFYIARPAENAYPTPFRLVAVHGDTTTFENPEHDFPQRIHYGAEWV